jgi:hypothetical protein
MIDDTLIVHDYVVFSYRFFVLFEKRANTENDIFLLFSRRLQKSIRIELREGSFLLSFTFFQDVTFAKNKHLHNLPSYV